MDLNLKDKVAVITGGSKGIGLATAELLTEEGARVVVGARTLTPALGSSGVQPVAVDLSTPEGPAALVDAAVRRHGGIDLLVNPAGEQRGPLRAGQRGHRVHRRAVAAGVRPHAVRGRADDEGGGTGDARP